MTKHRFWIAWLLMCRCTTEICGDGAVGVLEECDDGNDNPADGCHTCHLSEIEVENMQGIHWDVALEAGGDVVVAWEFSEQVFARILYAGGSWAGPAFRVNPTDVAVLHGISVDAGAAGGFTVAWQSGLNLFLQVFDAAGQAATGEILVFANPERTITTPNVSYIGPDRVLVTWDQPEIMGQIFLTDGTPVGSQLVINSTTEGTQSHAGVAAWGDGRFVVVWVSEHDDTVCGDITVQVLDQDGGFVGVETTAHETAQYCASHPSAAAMSDGGYWIGWFVGSQDFNYIRRYNADGLPVGEPTTILGTSGDRMAPVDSAVEILARSGEDLLAVWSDFYRNDTYPWMEYNEGYEMIFGLFLDSLGNPVSDTFFMSRFMEGTKFALDSDAAGRTAMAFCYYCSFDDSTYPIYLQRMNEDGAWAGAEPW